ncbi:hypothetical protein [Neptunomonas qingdaonensis]|uniref:Uncharacterized protein n=1 Tax=Neptunomonas qingdaonensis TaxID=1045558 RepID=A0A1I2MSK4_9GAMM|nr:hypothetical protein [Neptunomonas qingdaonensis]SFF94514.1 hypothetical protein SAMN05216175_10268 [Neptunomonas qingdaonensis]
MLSAQKTYTFSSLHIDIARNSTDDFNLFHDKKKWHQIHRNPFNGPIALGFQIEEFIEGAILDHRITNGENKVIDQHKLQYSNYQFTFTNPVKPDEEIEIKINKSIFSEKQNTPTLSNRVNIKSGGKLSVIGYKKESMLPLFLPDLSLPDLSTLKDAVDREFLGDTGFFVKRKFMNTSNAKNFLSGSLVEQSDFFDEIESKANFPEIFPCALISCALLEKAIKEKLDFKRNPMVYTSHKISIDRNQLTHLKSNDSLHLLVRPYSNGDDNASPLMQTHECYGVVNHSSLLFRSLITLVPLDGAP